MRYLIISKEEKFEPFFTNWFDDEKFDDDMIVCDLESNIYFSDNWEAWRPIEDDCL